MGNYVKAIVLIIILLFFITFGVKNSQPTRLNYLFNILNVELPLYGIVYVSIVIGILIGLAVGLRNRFKLKKKPLVLPKILKQPGRSFRIWKSVSIVLRRKLPSGLICWPI